MKQGKITQKFSITWGFYLPVCSGYSCITHPKTKWLKTTQVIELAHKLGRAKQDGSFLFHMPSARVAWLGAGESTSKMAGKLVVAISWKLS